jgi:hypothetical protein
LSLKKPPWSFSWSGCTYEQYGFLCFSTVPIGSA